MKCGRAPVAAVAVPNMALSENGDIEWRLKTFYILLLIFFLSRSTDGAFVRVRAWLCISLGER